MGFKKVVKEAVRQVNVKAAAKTAKQILDEEIEKPDAARTEQPKDTP